MSEPRRCDWVPEWLEDSLAYLGRQAVFPMRLAERIEELCKNPTTLQRVDADIYGLRIADLDAPQGGSELLVAIDYEDVGSPLLILLGIVTGSLAELQGALASTEYRRRINTAISRYLRYRSVVYS